MATPQLQNDPIYSLPHLYTAGMYISVASTTLLAIGAGQCRDSTDNIDIQVSFPNLAGNTFPPILFQNYMQPLLINSAVNGINGLDTGTIAASTQYAVYVIADSRGYNNPAGLLTLSSNAFPLIPLGYDSFRLLGFIETDGSSHFVFATHAPQTLGQNAYYLSPAVNVLTGGASTTFAGVDLNTPVPTAGLTNVIVTFLVVFIPAAVGDTLVMRPTGSTATTGLVTITGIAAGVAQTQYIQVIAGVNGSTHASIDYEVTSASDSATLSVVEWIGAPHNVIPT